MSKKEKINEQKPLAEILGNLRKVIEINVDLPVFKNNIEIIRQRLGKNTGIILAAKSSVYSLGTELVVHSRDIIDGIAVESFPVAFEHALAGFKKNIYILSPFLPQHIELLHFLNQYPNIIMCLDSLSAARDIVTRCQEKAYRIRVALKINFGLNRFGIHPGKLAEMVTLLDQTPVEIDSIYTHISGTTDAAIETLIEKEKRFLQLVEPYKHRGIKFHMADSACIVRDIGTRLSLVRTGLLPIGIDPVEIEHPPIPGLALCFKVTSTVLHITDVKKGEELGYRYFAPADIRVATIAGGYAHGFPRDALFKGFALIKGIKCPYAGKSFMEYSLLDISACHFPVEVGDPVEIFSEQCHPFHMAEHANNIPEIFFTGLASSIKRNYVQ